MRTDFEFVANKLVGCATTAAHLQYQYNADGQLKSGSSTGRTLRWCNIIYNGDGRLASVTDRAGHITTFTYDANHLLETISLPSQQAVNGQVQRFAQPDSVPLSKSVPWGDTPHQHRLRHGNAQW